LLGLSPPRPLGFESALLLAPVVDRPLERAAPARELLFSDQAELIGIEKSLDLPFRLGDSRLEPVELRVHDIGGAKHRRPALLLEGFFETLRRGEKLGDLLPNEIVELRRIDHGSWTASCDLRGDWVDSSCAVIVRVLSARVSEQGAVADAATRQAAKQILPLAPEIPAGESVVALHLLLCPAKRRRVDQGGHRNGYPFLPGP